MRHVDLCWVTGVVTLPKGIGEWFADKGRIPVSDGDGVEVGAGASCGIHPGKP